MLLTESEIERLLNQNAISDEWPWVTNDEGVIDQNIKEVVAEIRRKLRLADRTDYEHYGSGYASFVDCWLYRPDAEFRYRTGDNYYGLVILFSRLSPFYVFGQGCKSWDQTSGASYLPHFDFVDDIDHTPVMDLVPRVNKILTDRGLKQLSKSDLKTLLPRGVTVPTVMADRPFRHFDAMFYWED